MTKGMIAFCLLIGMLAGFVSCWLLLRPHTASPTLSLSPSLIPRDAQRFYLLLELDNETPEGHRVFLSKKGRDITQYEETIILTNALHTVSENCTRYKDIISEMRDPTQTHGGTASTTERLRLELATEFHTKITTAYTEYLRRYGKEPQMKAFPRSIADDVASCTTIAANSP